MLISAKQKAAPPTDIKTAYRPGMIVVIGASAGGIEAIRQLINALSPNSGIAFLYVQHPGSDSRSRLEAILSKATAVKVVHVKGPVRIGSDTLYLCPAGKNIIVQDGELRFSPRHSFPRTDFSIDRLFVSVAKTCGKDAIGILLSGNSSDGTAGLTAIKMSGGTTFVQDGTARYQVLPKAAIARGIVDYVLSPEKIAVELNRITESRKPQKPGPSGGETKTPDRDVARDELSRLPDSSIENIAGFFRYREAMTYLKKAVFPHILGIKVSGEPFRIWVPCCSTGEEVYSIAIILAEVLAGTPSVTRIQIFATDPCDKVLAKARSGTYSQAEVAGVSPGRLQRYFRNTDDGYRIIKPVRDLCLFARHDLLKDPPFCRIDLISCSNLISWLEDFPGKQVEATLRFALNPYGYLVLGQSETLRASPELFIQLHKTLKVYTKVKDTSPRDVLEMKYRLPSQKERAQEERPLKEVVDGATGMEVKPLPDGPAGKKILELEKELRITRDGMRTLIEELKAVNEELQAAKEEVLSLNEELQTGNDALVASREEVRTAYEKLIAVQKVLSERKE